MITLSAPYPAINVITSLPNPMLSDVANKNLFVDVQTSMNGTLFTYGRNEGTTRLTYTFTLATQKSLELRAFVEEFFSDQMLMVNHLGERWLVNIDGNPYEVAQQGKNNETVTIIFEGVKL